MFSKLLLCQKVKLEVKIGLMMRECGPSIKYMFNCADKFVENWDTWNKKRLMKQKQKKYREAQKQSYMINF